MVWENEEQVPNSFLENEDQVPVNVQLEYGGRGGSYLSKFFLYESCSNFYMFGRDKSERYWKVLKINRLEHSELCITEDSTTYSKDDCRDLIDRLNDGNKPTGGLNFVCTCYGIAGFIKFLGPYYMLLITKRKKIGTICGHAIYSIAKSRIITVQSNNSYSKNENRYKKLLRTMDLTKDFYFSYSYHVMLSLQKNMCNQESGVILYEKMFVWNEFLTRGIRNQLKNSVWTVALVYGFFKQVKLSICGRDFDLILIARRSRHYAGTRYLKRGVNEKGRVANDVETEQIVLEDAPEGNPSQISSVVQNRGSIPLFWSQETSRLNIKPDIILSKNDPSYSATKLHFQNLVKRYGNPIIILNLIKTREKKPRESILRAEFANAIEAINKDLVNENRLKFLHWDLSKHSRNKSKSVLEDLAKVATNMVDLIGFFYCQLRLPSRFNSNNDYVDKDLSNMMRNTQDLELKGSINDEGDGNTDCADKDIPDTPLEGSINDEDGNNTQLEGSFNDEDDDCADEDLSTMTENTQYLESDSTNDEGNGNNDCADKTNDEVDGNNDCADKDLSKSTEDTRLEDNTNDECDVVKPPVFQKGVLRTNCIDCLDRTNVAQYAYGLVALGRQLHALGYINDPNIGLNSPLADALMKIYEAMGDVLARQYGGSAAHNKIFQERRGQWKAATQSQEFFRTLQRYYSNTWVDAEKQDAINVFLGHFVPQQGKPALWELDSDQHYGVNQRGSKFAGGNASSTFKRSLSDGNILFQSIPTTDGTNIMQVDKIHNPLPVRIRGCEVGLSEATPKFLICDGDISESRYTPSMSCRQLFPDLQSENCLENDSICLAKRGSSCSNFLDARLLSASWNSLEEDTSERSSIIGSSPTGLSSGEIKAETSSSYSSGLGLEGNAMGSRDICHGSPWSTNDVSGFSEQFMHWIDKDWFFP